MRRRAFWCVLLSLAILTQGSTLQRPEDQAEPWSPPIDITGGSTENWRAFGRAVCDRFQNLHVFWIDNGDEDSAIYYRNDLEDAWSQPRDVVVAPDTLNYDLVAVAANDSLHLAWRAASGGLYYSGSPIAYAEDPSAWSPPQLLDESVFSVSLAVGPEGILHLVYSSPDPEGLEYYVVHRSSADNGVTWTDPRVVFYITFTSPSYIRTEMAMDAANRIHIGLTLRSQEYGRNSEVGYLRSEDGGQTWGAYRMIESRTNAPPGLEWIAPYAFGENEVHLTWHDPRRMHQWSTDGGTTWSGAVQILELGAAFGGPNALARDSAGTIYAVTAWSDGVYASRWLGSNWSIPVPIDLREIDPHGQQITVCQGNVLHVLYHDRTGDETVWYSSRTTAASHVPRLPLPETPPLATQPATSLAQSEAPSTSTVSPTLTPANAMPFNRGPIVPTPSPVAPLVIGTLSVLGFLAAVVVIRMKKTGR